MEAYVKDPGGPIEEFSWGRYVIKGETHEKTDGSKKGKGKDICLIGNRVKKWKERKGHTLEPHMVSRVFDKDIDTLVIGIGVEGRIECPEEVKKESRKNGISELILLKTPDACKKYNELYHQGRHVALLAHGTC
ncbi:MAG: hypothetical protein KGY60_02010 [Bacteroidales bacterium]|nr:hypothetical protein [Bacteroidales bacterium]